MSRNLKPANVTAGKIKEAARERYKMTGKSAFARDYEKGLAIKGRACA